MENAFNRNEKFGNLAVEIYSTRQIMGMAAAIEVAQKTREILVQKNEVRMIFAAAPSQNELLSELIKIEGIDWSRIVAFHMDEYLGLRNDAPQAFGQFLRDRIFNKVAFKKVHYLQTADANAEELCKEYTKLLLEAPIDIVCMGIGENGHIAFNDPPYADFNDSEWVKVVELDNVSRQQQVNDGCFRNLDEVPGKAVTLTIPALLSGESLFIVVPGSTKANAVKKALSGPITEDCPASILRKHKDAKLFLDYDSAALIIETNQ